jgi:hypothetical protein
MRSGVRKRGVTRAIGGRRLIALDEAGSDRLVITQRTIHHLGRLPVIRIEEISKTAELVADLAKNLLDPLELSDYGGRADLLPSQQIANRVAAHEVDAFR